MKKAIVIMIIVIAIGSWASYPLFDYIIDLPFQEQLMIWMRYTLFIICISIFSELFDQLKKYQ